MAAFSHFIPYILSRPTLLSAETWYDKHGTAISIHRKFLINDSKLILGNKNPKNNQPNKKNQTPNQKKTDKSVMSSERLSCLKVLGVWWLILTGTTKNMQGVSALSFHQAWIFPIKEYHILQIGLLKNSWCEKSFSAEWWGKASKLLLNLNFAHSLWIMSQILSTHSLHVYMPYLSFSPKDSICNCES